MLSAQVPNETLQELAELTLSLICLTRSESPGPRLSSPYEREDIETIKEIGVIFPANVGTIGEVEGE